MEGDAYTRERLLYQDVSGTLDVTTSTDDTTLITVRNATHTIYIQQIFVFIKTDAAQSLSFEDSNSSAKKIFGVSASPGLNAKFSMDWGPRGITLTEGKNFLLNVSATGLACQITWYGYQKMSSATGFLSM